MKTKQLLSCILFVIISNLCFGQDITTNLIAHFKLNGDFTDASLNGNNALNSGAVSTFNRAQMPNTAFDFNGTNQSATAANSTSLSSVSSNLTISLWAYIRGFDLGIDGKNYAVLVCKANNEDKADYRIAVTPNYFSLINNGKLWEISSSVGIPTNKWTHYSAVISDTFAKVYIDGVKVGEGSLAASYPLQKNCPLTLGRDDAGSIEYLDGKLDDIRIFARSLTDNDITKAYQTMDYVLDSSKLDLIAYYPFDGNVMDFSGNGNNGTTHGGSYSTDQFGRSNKSYLMDGNSQYIEASNSVSLSKPVRQISFTAWVNVNQFVKGIDGIDYAVLICKSNSSNNAQYRLALTLNGISVINNGFLGSVNGTTNFTMNTWYHVGAVIEDSLVKYYLNGNLVNSSVINIPFGKSSDNTLMLGRDDPGGIEYFNGKMDEVRIYSRKLLDYEMRKIYTLTNSTSFRSLDFNRTFLDVFPNPAKDLIFISGLEFNTEVPKIKIFTIDCKEIECLVSKENNDFIIRIPDDLNVQMVFLKIQSETNKVFKKVLISKLQQ